MSRRGENITKRADGRWEARYIKGRAENGKALYGFVYARTYTEVKEKRKQRFNAESEPPKNIDDISKIINAFLMSKKTEVKESTYAHYRQLINNHILTYWNGKRIRDITSPMLEDYKLFLINSGGNKKNGLSKKTVKEVLGLLHQIFKYSEMLGLSNNPFKDFKMPKATKPEIIILSRADQKILEQETKDSSDKLFGIYLCLYTGLRLGEICALKWEDIDFSSGILSVKRSMQRISLSADGSTVKTKIRIDTPKTESSYRDIPLSSTLLHMLEERKAKITDTRSYFLTGSDNYVEPRNYYKFYKRQEKECGIGDYTFHALRHTFATRCIECGVDAKSLSEVLGHADVKITLERYVHSSVELKRMQMEKLSVGI